MTRAITKNAFSEDMCYRKISTWLIAHTRPNATQQLYRSRATSNEQLKQRDTRQYITKRHIRYHGPRCAKMSHDAQKSLCGKIHTQ